LKLGQHGGPCLSNYQLTDELCKEKLLDRIKKDPLLITYIPDSENLASIEREFLLAVSIIFM